MSKTAAIFGSTGLIGKTLTDLLRQHSEIETIFAYARKPPMFLENKIQFKPFETNNFTITSDIDMVFCALGTTIKKAGNREDFKEVDLYAVKRIAEQTREAGIKNLVVISSVGADKSSSNFYLRTKGKMEEAVQNAGIDNTVIIRPSLLLGKRNEKRPAEDLAKILFKPLRLLMVGPLKQYRPVPARKVAEKMIEGAFRKEKGSIIVENRDL